MAVTEGVAAVAGVAAALDVGAAFDVAVAGVAAAAGAVAVTGAVAADCSAEFAGAVDAHTASVDATAITSELFLSSRIILCPLELDPYRLCRE